MKRISQNIIDNLKIWLPTPNFSSIHEMEISSSASVSFIYPTDDLLLSKHQFQCFMKAFRQENTFYIMQIGPADNYSDMTNVVYEFDSSISEKEYHAFEFYSMSLMFSNSFDWVLVIEESLEGGIGLLIGSDIKVKQFEDNYGRLKQDIANYVSFCVDDSSRNSYSLSNLKKIIRLLR